MYSFQSVTEDLYYVGVDDHRLNLFENIHPLPYGVSYNSYILMDEKTVMFDCVDYSMGHQFIENVKGVLGDRKLDYLIMNHLEPDHASTLAEILLIYPEVTVVSNEKALLFMGQFGYHADHTLVVKEGDELCVGKHVLTFAFAPMVHWPEVMITYDKTDKVAFTADAFGTFGSLSGRLFADELPFDRPWIDEARRYYTNIVGKFGANVQRALKKLSSFDIQYICPLHGPVWRENTEFFIDLHNHWSTYTPEEEGVLIIYASMYGNTASVCRKLADDLSEAGMKNIKMMDVSLSNTSYIIAEIFRYSHLVFASPTYNLGCFPLMDNLLTDMAALNVQNRTVALIENGTWAIKAGAIMKEKILSMKNMNLLENLLTIKSSLPDEEYYKITEFKDQLIASMPWMQS